MVIRPSITIRGTKDLLIFSTGVPVVRQDEEEEEES